MLVGTLGSTGGFGVPFYTKIVVSGGDSWMRRASPVRVLCTTVRPCPAGRVAASRRSRRAASIALVAGNGSGPEGSSLTADYPRSRGSGTEKCADQSVRRLVDKFSGLVFTIYFQAAERPSGLSHLQNKELGRLRDKSYIFSALPRYKCIIFASSTFSFRTTPRLRAPRSRRLCTSDNWHRWS